MAFAVLAALQVWLIFSHSPWFDEEHALLIARAPWADLKHNLSYEGHPALWYLWLGSIDRLLGGSPWSLPVAQAPVSLGLLWIVWFRAPFQPAVKLLLSLSYFFVFEYGVISRSYALGALLLLSAVPLRRSIWGWVCLALAANTSAHDLLGAGALAMVFFCERPAWRGPSVLTIGVVVALATVYPIAPDLYPTAGAPHGGPIFRTLHALRMLGYVLVPNMPTWPYTWLTLPDLRPGALIGIVACVAGAWTLRRSRVLMAGYLGLFVCLFVMSVAAYEISPRHVGVLFVYLVSGWWMLAGRADRLIWGWLGIGVFCAAPIIIGTPTRPFTHHREIARWIEHHGLADQTWGAWPGREGTTITAQLGRPTVNLEKDCRNTFVRWDYPHERVADPLGHVRRGGVTYVISETEIPQGQVLARFGKGGGWEWPVTLYRFKGDPTVVVPVCR